MRNEIISRTICPRCGYEEQVNKPLRQYPDSELNCPNCEYEQRDFTVIRNLTLENEEANLVLGYLSLAKNEILHCDTSKGQIAIEFCH